MKTQYPVLIIRGGISGKTLIDINQKLEKSFDDTLYMILDSTGGDPSVGYRIMSGLQNKYKKIIVIVTNIAYSTATLMALGADTIYMHKTACLGPLDIQIKHPSNGSMVSSLEIREILNTLAGLSKTYSEDFYDELTSTFELGKNEAADLSMKSANDLIRPIVEKIDPVYLQAGIRTSKLGQKYAEKLLLNRMMKGHDDLARLVSMYLANEYDYHGYAITPTEASNLLALNVQDIDELDVWDQIKEIIEANINNGVSLKTMEIVTDDPPQKTSKKDIANAKMESGVAK